MDKMKQLLLDWEFDEEIIENFMRHKITEDMLEKLPNSYIDQLIPAIGDRLKFIDHRQKFLKLRPKKSKISDVKEIIERSEDGRDISDFYEFEESMDHGQRVKIINIILDVIFERKIKLSRKDFDELSDQILAIFPNELKTMYYEPHRGRPPTGLLYKMYYDRLDATTKKNEDDVPLQNQIWNCLMEEGVHESIEYLKQVENDDKDLLLERWDKTFKVRNLKIKMHSTFDETLHDWPPLRKPYGTLLISNDFTEEYGQECAESLKTKWNSFFEKNFHALQGTIKDILARNRFRNIENEENINFKNVTLALSMHYLLPPAKTSTNNCTWTPSIPDSKNSFFKLVTKSSMKREIDKRNNVRSMKKIDHHPMIFGFGASLEEIDEFAVVISDVAYFEFTTFIDALDVAFKIFNVFNLKFTPESVNFWIFLNEMFYNTDIKYKSCPKLKSLLTNFEKIN